MMDKEFLETWATYLDDLQALIKPHFTDEAWARVFKRTDTPAQAAEKLRDIAKDQSKPSGNTDPAA